ncbi:MAG: chemotaxis-specific protein-glutamate methyltransferase CheB [Bacteroidales bacterium]|nr:chemotaxis-specific protein-glutamate methyltransferase CheB [Bacteroidales bacterium]
MNRKTKILIVDDSKVTREILRFLIQEDGSMEVIGLAQSAFEAVDIMKTNVPDVMLLDIQMPIMDGLTFLQKIMSQHPLKVLIVSSIIDSNNSVVAKALKLGAIGVIRKPFIKTKNDLDKFGNSIRQKIIESLEIQQKNESDNNSQISCSLSVNDIYPLYKRITNKKLHPVICIGASTGGIYFLELIFAVLTHKSPPVVVVQHISYDFVSSLVQRLNNTYLVNIVEAYDGCLIENGNVYFAKGGSHTIVKRIGDSYYLKILNKEPVNRHKPSIDVLFRSAALECQSDCTGILLTGMGSDGAVGLLDILNNGGLTIAQDEETSIVFGMPKKAIELGAAKKVYSIDTIVDFIKFMKHPLSF